MHSPNFIKKYYEKNIAETKIKIKESVCDDNFIIQCAGNIDELDRVANLLVRRLREWYELYNPEYSRKIIDNKSFVELILAGEDKKLKNSMGADLKKNDINQFMNLAKRIAELFRQRESHDTYLESIMNRNCPNTAMVAGSLIGAKLLSHAGSLKRLSIMTASTIQLLGAEKALFRHMRTGARAPKHGLILQHKMMDVPAKNRGKMARIIADKISIAAKVDYFKGEFVGKRLKRELEAKHKLLQ